ncbi:helix-turn-helix domain-containing protein [Vibrio crassostreae]|uniref:AraC-type DNA-binding domain-containing protein n=1 Tax=Vibrio crassostreae TaxID=246167 RepID=A0ABM9QUQ4_9VIBR|nr:AraC family transcriptional regulator [Vibrio crassostreae]ROP22235.1 AraC family transcriptional regulator [Vibrio crassostreae]ROP23330.1 AraC family transcriptional regulator [Vibrio crassostreae]ROS67451.1 AraC family transcriptional regulator [Vibrio crassostreae]RPE98135.1 AraC family transcriptional regulator [Vibrio crassostreae]TCL29004.1 AraC family transcriptional regulator [Vibrio crassostreae]
MSSITVTQFRNFIPRKRERYPASKNGIFMVSKGSISFMLPNGTEASLQAGDFTLYNSGQIKDITVNTENGEFSATCLDFDLAIFQKFINQFSDLESTRIPDKYIKFNHTDTEIYQLKELIMSLANSSSQNDYALTQLGLSLLSLMVEQYPALLVIIARASRLTVTQKVIHYIEQNIENNISLDTLASYMGMSPATLKRRLSAEDLSFSNLLKIKRIAHAATQLRTSDKSITQIAYESGFKSAAHFSTAFKTYHGKTPKDFRSLIARAQQQGIKPPV